LPMRLHSMICPLFLIALIWMSAPGHAISQRSLELIQRNPDGWFTLSVPKAIGEVGRHADVDGGFYVSDDLEVDYDYWTQAGTPNWLRGKYATSLLLACPRKGKNTRTLRTRIDGNRAVIQQCSQTDESQRFRYMYYVTFPKLRVFDGEGFHYGMFNLRVGFRNRRHLSVAREIVRSLDFDR
jgi:hypothetical protein